MIVCERTVLCADCAASSYLKPEVSAVRVVDSRTEGTTTRFVLCCQHCVVVDVVRTENKEPVKV